ncbi:hypothetical protein HELRODRAFT_171337 [Helobdella robusta]|uniref:Uncharacterized protein n=1 Tax=Helobdella robusta TaxID=6412 RepID=T1F448_HELRO|nr:hypothetical protein HELRODRAFT_171337 [Helobdella robusta]ESO05677.1 hypothetical protein HELRODRAFT_171337 [Helobdella robusta]
MRGSGVMVKTPGIGCGSDPCIHNAEGPPRLGVVWPKYPCMAHQHCRHIYTYKKHSIHPGRWSNEEIMTSLNRLDDVSIEGNLQLEDRCRHAGTHTPWKQIEISSGFLSFKSCALAIIKQYRLHGHKTTLQTVRTSPERFRDRKKLSTPTTKI